MRTFIRHLRSGEIVSVAMVEAMPAHLDQPFDALTEQELVLEVDDAKVTRNTTAAELHDNYRVDVAKGKLVKIRKAG